MRRIIVVVTQLPMPEPADLWIEEVLSNTCPVHPGTTRSRDGICAVCEVEDALFAEPRPLQNPWRDVRWSD